MWNWLVAQGLYKDVLAALVAIGMSALFAWRPFKKFRQTQKETADLLDTHTPGGLTDVINAVNSSRRATDVRTDDGP